MNKKLLAVAVAGTLAAPMAAQAASGHGVYGRLNTALNFNNGNPLDTAGETDSQTDVANVASRFGVRGEEDLGNGLSAVYQIEMKIASDKGGTVDSVVNPGQRITLVGLKGNFGQIALGSQWGAFFNHYGTFVDPWQSIGSVGYYQSGGSTRIPDDLQYSGSFGPVSLQVDLQMESGGVENTSPDRWAAGLTYAGGAFSIGAAAEVISEGGVVGTEDDEKVGIGGKFSGDGWWLGAGYNERDQGAPDKTKNVTLVGGWRRDAFQILAQVSETSDAAQGVDVTGFGLGLYNHMSRSFRVYLESAFNDISGGPNDGDGVYKIFLGMRKGFN